MREIKFRAWDKVYEDMYPVVTMDFTEWWVSIGEIGNIHGERNSFKNEEFDRYILMQYTGLKDRNGKEIYEGDQLFAPGNLSDELEYVGDVEWDEDDARFEVVNLHGRFEYIPDGCEVKGNIYEDPELLRESAIESNE